MNANAEKMLELAMIRGLPDLVGRMPRGRLKGKLEKLINFTDKELACLGLMSQQDFEEVKNKLFKFGEVTGWEGSRKSIATIVSFLLDMIENSKYNYDNKISEYLNDIFEYFDRHKNVSLLCMKAGEIAEDKWKKLQD